MGTFVKLRGSDGQYYFNLLASNGQVILSSEPYITDTQRNNGIYSVHVHAFDSVRFEKRISPDGKYYFIVKDPDDHVIGKSIFYASEAGRDNGIESVKNNARDAEVEAA